MLMKGASQMSLKMDKWNVPKNKRASPICLKKSNVSVPQKGQPQYPSKRTSCMSLKKDTFRWNVRQKGHVECPSKRAC